MFYVIFILGFLWFVRETKVLLFWIYLWQLKEYHIGRFLVHFETERGKRLIFSTLNIIKILFLFSFFIFSPAFPFLLLILYLAESFKVLTDFLQNKIKRPVLTKKTAVLISAVLIFEILFLIFLFSEFREIHQISLRILIFDLLTPAIASAIVLFFQPITALWRWQIIQKAKKKREEFKELSVIGITGSYGKTSTKEFLTEILSQKFKVLKTKEHQNSEVAISSCILNDLKEEHQIFICEMGAYNKGGIKLLADICKPKIGILTGINEQHMATFGSRANTIKTKYELIKSLPDSGLAIFNGNNKHCLELYQKTKKPKKICYNKFFAIVDNVLLMDIWGDDVKVEKEQLSFKVFSKDGHRADFTVNLLGVQNIENLLMAVCCAKELGMSLEEISRACQKIESEQGGMKLIKTRKGFNIIDSTYSANPNGVISHLEYLKIWEGKKIIVMPCLIELGRASKEVHRRIGGAIGRVCNLAIIITKERFKEIKEGAIKAGLQKEKTLFLENPKEIFERIKNFCKPGDAVLLESRVPKELIGLLSD